MTIPQTGLPIEECLPRFLAATMNSSRVILEADPGAGKTTLVPLYLLQDVVRSGQKILMLEPRRLAARASARRMADLLGEKVGETVGYRVRLDSKISGKTRIEVVTEGILTTRLHDDPELSGVGLIIFDEFHERSLQTDLGLALSLQVQEILREDLKIVVMSATLDSSQLSALLGDAPVIESRGRQFPVETRYIPQKQADRLEITVAAAVRTALEKDQGDILVFLPGAGEINRAARAISSLAASRKFSLVQLYGSLGPKDQDRAILPDPKGLRKVVLSTDIAETSLTIEGVQVVIDAGLSRAPRFDPNSGMTRLETSRVSRASADQRRGRAGRLAPGVCYRLWAEPLNHGLAEFSSPEISVVDLCGLVLDMADWGTLAPDELKWLNPPPQGHVAQARDLLRELRALDDEGRITPLGKQMARLPLHPRLARMVLKAKELKAEFLACSIAALLSERDILQRDREAPSTSLLDRLDLLEASGNRQKKGVGIPTGQVLQVRDDLVRRLGTRDRSMDPGKAGLLLATAYPDRIGELREGSKVQYRLSGGRGARLPENDRLASEPYIVVGDLDGKGREATIRLAAPIQFGEIEKAFQNEITESRRVFWDEKRQRVLAVTERKVGALVLESKILRNPDPQEIIGILLDVVREKGLGLLPWDEESLGLVARVAFAAAHDPESGWSDLSEEALLEGLENWLGPFLPGITTLSGIKSVNLTQILKALIPHELQRQLDQIAPAYLEVPSGSRIRLDYSDPESPVLAVRLQEIFGLKDVPRLANGKVAVSVHLLSPALRPVQITQDLASFWRTTYGEVRKDMKGRYPKHYWPDDPLQAEPTSRAKPRKP